MPPGQSKVKSTGRARPLWESPSSARTTAVLSTESDHGERSWARWECSAMSSPCDVYSCIW